MSQNNVNLDTDISEFVKISNKYKVLNQDQEREYLNAYKLDPLSPEGKNAEFMLMVCNMGLVISVAKKYLNRGLPFSDLVVIGMAGLHKGIVKFDCSRVTDKGKPLKLSTYVTWWIRQGITRAITDTGKIIRVPVNVWGEYVQVQRMFGKIVETTEERPNPTELADLMNIAQEEAYQKLLKEDPEKAKKLKPKTAEQMAELQRIFSKVGQLDNPNSEDENLSTLDYLSIEEEKLPDSLYEKEQNLRGLSDLLEQLTEEERSWIMLQYGLIDGKPRDKRAMSTLKKKSPEIAAEKERAILEKLRNLSNIENFSL